MSESSKMDAIRQRFETELKPVLPAKPKLPKCITAVENNPIEHKILTGSSPTVTSVTDINKFPKAVTKISDPDIGNKDDNETQEKMTDGKVSNNANSTTIRRNSKLNIPTAFQTNLQAHLSSTDKPKPWVMPHNAQHTTDNDTNNNSNVDGPVNVGKMVLKDAENVSDTEVKHARPFNKPTLPVDTKTQNLVDTVSGEQKPRAGGSVSALASALGSKIHVDIKPGVKPGSLKHTDIISSDRAASSSDVHKKVMPGAVKIPLESMMRTKAGFKSANIKQNQMSAMAVIRPSDGIRFVKVNPLDIKDCGEAIEKPAKLNEEIDLDLLMKDFKEAQLLVSMQKKDNGCTETVDCSNAANDRVVSLILPLSAEEEQEWQQAGFPGMIDASPPPPMEMLQEDYDDVGIAIKGEETEDPEIFYEPLPDDEPEDSPPLVGPKLPELPTGVILRSNKNHSESLEDGIPEPPPTIPREKSKDPKDADKEKMRKGKEEKDLLKKKERDIEKLMDLFKIDAAGLAMSLGKGMVKETAKAKNKKTDLSVNKGDIVDIVRIVGNPPGKWLVRIFSSQKVGYCKGDNIEVDTNIIRTTMAGNGSSSGPSGSTDTVSKASDLQLEIYDDVANAGTEQLQEDEIYEECS